MVAYLSLFFNKFANQTRQAALVDAVAKAGACARPNVFCSACSHNHAPPRHHTRPSIIIIHRPNVTTGAKLTVPSPQLHHIPLYSTVALSRKHDALIGRYTAAATGLRAWIEATAAQWEVCGWVGTLCECIIVCIYMRVVHRRLHSPSPPKRPARPGRRQEREHRGGQGPAGGAARGQSEGGQVTCVQQRKANPECVAPPPSPSQQWATTHDTHTT